MIDNKDTPAFPTTTWEQMSDGRFVQITEHSGLTKREQIAAMAMQGILSNPQMEIETTPVETIAEDAARLADALLDQLSKPQS